MKKFEILLALVVAGAAYYFFYASHEEAAPVPVEAPKPARATPAPEPKAAVVPEMPAEDIDAKQQIETRFMTGDYQTALRLADKFGEQFRSSTFTKWLDAQMGAILVSAAWELIKVAKCEDAIPLFQRAEAIKATQESAKGLAFCLFKEHSLPAAEERAHWYLEQKHDDADMLALYSEILESSQRYTDALKALEELAALTENPEDKKELGARIKAMRQRSKEGDRQQTVSTQHFMITFRENEHRTLVDRAGQILERSVQEFCDDFGFREPKVPIEVIFYPGDQFKETVPNAPTWSDGIFDGRIRIPVRRSWLTGGDLNIFEINLRHELVHAMFAQMTATRRLPPWFDEGMAQYASCPQENCAFFKLPIKAGGFYDENSFLNSYISYERVKAERIYNQSLFLVRSLIRERGRSALREIIDGIKVDSPLKSDALLRPLDMRFSKLVSDSAQMWQELR